MKKDIFKIEHNVSLERSERSSKYRATADAMKPNDSVWFPTFGKALTLARYIMKTGKKYSIRKDAMKGKPGFRTVMLGRVLGKGKKKAA